MTGSCSWKISLYFYLFLNWSTSCLRLSLCPSLSLHYQRTMTISSKLWFRELMRGTAETASRRSEQEREPQARKIMRQRRESEGGADHQTGSLWWRRDRRRTQGRGREWELSWGGENSFLIWVMKWPLLSKVYF